MPVNDFNAVKMATEAVSILETTESGSEFWKMNTSIISYMLIGAIIIAAFLFVLFFLTTKFRKIFHK